MGPENGMILILVSSMVIAGFGAWVGQAIFLRNEYTEDFKIRCYSKSDATVTNVFNEMTLKINASVNWVFHPGILARSRYSCKIAGTKNRSLGKTFDVFNGLAPPFPCIENYWILAQAGIYYYTSCSMKGDPSKWKKHYYYHESKDGPEMLEQYDFVAHNPLSKSNVRPRGVDDEVDEDDYFGQAPEPDADYELTR